VNKVFGREKLIERIWKLLQEFSILFTAERRVGKTTVLNELQHKPKEGFRVIFSDLEKIDSPLEFINDVLNKTSPFISSADRTSGWFFKLWEVLEGIEVGGLIKIPEHKEKDWKEILQVTIAAICNNTDDIVVFLWDEVPYMLQKINEHEIAKGSVERSSLKIMDTLRALRQEHDNLRMVFTGSIGLHHVLNTLTNETYASESVNDMEKVELLPLDLVSAKEMVEFLLEKEGALKRVGEPLVESIACQCDFIPFYIEKLIRRLVIHEQPVTKALVNQEVAFILTDASDDWELEHFRKRLNTYYNGEIVDANERKIKRSVIAKSILNHCAVSSEPQSIDDCYRAVKSNYSIDDRELIIAILNSLIKDHYLQRDVKGHYRFCFSLVQRWWILAEGLSVSEGSDYA
jgi:AAA+ ATPase superfamily predicted ATPase